MPTDPLHLQCCSSSLINPQITGRYHVDQRRSWGQSWRNRSTSWTTTLSLSGVMSPWSRLEIPTVRDEAVQAFDLERTGSTGIVACSCEDDLCKRPHASNWVFKSETTTPAEPPSSRRPGIKAAWFRLVSLRSRETIRLIDTLLIISLFSGNINFISYFCVTSMGRELRASCRPWSWYSISFCQTYTMLNRDTMKMVVFHNGSNNLHLAP